MFWGLAFEINLPKPTATIYYAGFWRFGGVLSHVRALERELRRIGWDVTVITLDSLPIWCRYAPHLIWKMLSLFNRPMGFLYKDRATRALYKHFFDDNTDIRIFEDIYITWNSEIPSISMLHAVWSDNLQSHPGTARQKQQLKSHEARIIERIHHPVATVSHPYSKYIKDEHFAGRLSKQIEVVELGIDQSNFPETPNGNKKSIVYVGALEARKNVLFLLEVFKRIAAIDPEYRLTIVGDGPEQGLLDDFVISNGLTVDFLGRLSHEKIAPELHRHGVYLHTSIKESFSYSLLEAKLAGLKTCAYAKLQVPSEFIDVAIGSFDADEWCRGILNIDWTPAAFNAENYTVEKMTRLTLGLAR